jgi:hypothetical protein
VKPVLRRIVCILALTACSVALLSGTLRSAAADPNVLTYHNDNANTGQNLCETILNPASVSVNQFGMLFAYPVDGYVYAQPLYMSNVPLPDGSTHNIVFVATEHDSVYAFDADSNAGSNGGLLWQTSFINPALGVTTVPWQDVIIDDTVPEIGITSTPVIDPATNTLYVVAKTKEAVNGAYTYVQRIHALDITTGTEKFGGPVVIQGSVLGTAIDSVGGVLNFDPLWGNQRAALLLLNGTLYIGWGSHGDKGNYHGWLMAYNAQTLQQTGVFCASPNNSDNGIWMGGAHPAADSNGNLFVTTSNGPFDITQGGVDYGDTLLRINTANGGLNVSDYFTPFNQSDLSDLNQDLGAGGVTVLPDSVGSIMHPHLLTNGGKEGKYYLRDRDNLGGFDPLNDYAFQNFNSTGQYGPPAYFNGIVYYGGASRPLRAISLLSSTLGFQQVSQTAFNFAWPGTIPSISADSTNINPPATAIVWAIENNGLQAVLHAFAATNLSGELYNSTQAGDRDNPGNYVKFTAPTIANGKVYVGTQYRLSVYGNGSWVDEPVITPNGSDSRVPVNVSITDPTPGAQIYYTTDGTDPTTASTPYNGSFTLSACTTVRARAFLAGWNPSGIIEGDFLVDGGPGSGNGLLGFYYPTTGFTGTPTIQIDPTVGFNWQEGTSPTTNIAPTNFSVRWTGWVQARGSGTYTFSTLSDDGIRVWVNGQAIIDDWTSHRELQDSATVNLTAGQIVPIRIDYYQKTRYAVAQLLWSGPGIAKQIVPQSQLYAMPTLNTLTLSPSTVAGGLTTTGTVVLNGPAPYDMVFNLTCANPMATVPATVTVPAGNSSANFNITTVPVAASVSGVIQATYCGLTVGRTLTVRPIAASAVSMNPNPAPGGSPVTGTVTLEEPAAPGAVVVQLSSSNPALANPTVTSVTVPQGATTATFTITTALVSDVTPVSITATTAGKSYSGTLNLRPIAASAVSMNPNPAPGGSPVTGTVTLEAPAAPGAVVVQLSSSNSTLANPTVTSVTVPQGATTATFTITTALVSDIASVTITAGTPGRNKTGTLTVRPIGASAVSMRPNPAKGGSIVTGTVTLEAPAAPGAVVVQLSSSNPALANPTVSSVTIPQGATTATFTIVTQAVSASTQVVITASTLDKSKTGTLTLNP